MIKNILVVGGAGYIGSHMVKALARNGYRMITLDNLTTGFRDAVHFGELIEGSMADRVLLDEIFARYEISAVMHFAAYSQVGESMSDPGKYYRNNVAATQVLLDAMLAHGVNKLVFSSTAAVYGNPIQVPIDESHPTNPINPYGKSKLMVEQMLADYDQAYGMRSVSLRYFNAAGADSEGKLGERHDPETHLIPLILQAGLGERDAITIFGEDYDTPDGTCIRDYIHIEDLCKAHLLAVQALLRGEESQICNLGNGTGFSVKEVIDVSEAVLGHTIPKQTGERRPGDPAVLVANADKAHQVLGWQPDHTDLNAIIAHAAYWEKVKIALRGEQAKTIDLHSEKQADLDLSMESSALAFGSQRG